MARRHILGAATAALVCAMAAACTTEPAPNSFRFARPSAPEVPATVTSSATVSTSLTSNGGR